MLTSTVHVAFLVLIALMGKYFIDKFEKKLSLPCGK